MSKAIDLPIDDIAHADPVIDSEPRQCACKVSNKDLPEAVRGDGVGLRQAVMIRAVPRQPEASDSSALEQLREANGQIKTCWFVASGEEGPGIKLGGA